MVTAPLGLGRRIVAPLVPAFHAAFPSIEIRLRLSDRKVDYLAEGVDVAFALGDAGGLSLKMRTIADCERVLCAAPSYLAARGAPETPNDLLGAEPQLPAAALPRLAEYFWTFATHDGPLKLTAHGAFDADDAEVLTDWALQGAGIANRPRFEVAGHLASGALVPLLAGTPPLPIRFACLYPHRRLQDPKVQVFIPWMVERCRQSVRELLGS